MIIAEFGESVLVFVPWLLLALISRALGMRNNDGQKTRGDHSPRSGRVNGFIPSSFRAISSYLRIVSSGASTVARSAAASVASSIVDRDGDSGHDQVLWAGFDKLEGKGDVNRRVLLLGYQSGFQVWDVEEADDVRDLVSRHDGPASFMQVLPNPVSSTKLEDKFYESRPLLVVCGDSSGGHNFQDGFTTHHNGNMPNNNDNIFVPTTVRFYSLRSQSYPHVLKFRSAVYSVRCSSRVVAVSQAAQIHCFHATSLERSYTILTNPVVSGPPGVSGVGYGPLAVGPRWLAYSGSPVIISNGGRVTPQPLQSSTSFSGLVSNGSLAAHYAKESSKHLAAGIVTLGDMGYKKLSRYYSELRPDSSSPLSGSCGRKGAGVVNGHPQDANFVGMVIVRDIISKSVVAQFKAHKSHVSALSFDPSGTILVTASVTGHNINVFKITPVFAGTSTSFDVGSSCVHLYRLQRGLTNAVIQDISFSDDSCWIMISSSRGTGHLFAIDPSGGSVSFQSAESTFAAQNGGWGVATKSAVRWPPTADLQMPSQQNICGAGNPVTLSAISRIRNGNNGWRGTVSGAAAVATGKFHSLPGAIASCFYICKRSDSYADRNSSKAKYHLLVFSPSGCMIQYALQISNVLDSMPTLAEVGNAYESEADCDGRMVVEAIQKWNICQKHTRREREDNFDIYGENGSADSKKIYPEGIIKGSCNSVVGIDAAAKIRISFEEKHHFYISEAELQMHQAQIPLWAKPGIIFQSMVAEDVKSDEENASEGEIEVEKISSHIIEARSKDLVPVFDYLQMSKNQHARIVNLSSYSNGRLQHQTSALSEKGKLSFRSSLKGSNFAVAQQDSVEETALYGLVMPEESKDFVNGNVSMDPETGAETVNKRESTKLEDPPKNVNSNKEGSTMDNNFEDEGDELD
ncbi:autophagy-related protein 18f [Rhodamnia argentea]|uniref:Autophagy-related protein 18f n=1 Tax=Rhodamnia argentea TaxID=178133 RepID=A0A8B8NA45_9MYRT|nr:autophagy-related protein 18f [Rhodamnia argentea]